MRRLLSTILLIPALALAQVTTSPSVTGVPAPQSAVAITGGTINGTVIGNTTPAAITGTSGAFNAAITSTSGVFGTAALIDVAATTNQKVIELANTGNSGFYFAIQNSAGNFFTGPAAYDSVLSSPNNIYMLAPSVTVGTAFRAPGLATSSAATTGTMCWTTGTGNVNVDTTTTCLLSSEKYKQNGRPLNVGLNAIMAMRPVSYELKPQYNPTGLGEQIGLYAEDVARVDPRLVSTEADGSPHAVRYQQLTAVLVKAIQEQQKQIKALRQDVQMLRRAQYAGRPTKVRQTAYIVH